MKNSKKMNKATQELYNFIVKELPVIKSNMRGIKFSLGIDGLREYLITIQDMTLVANKLNSSCDNTVKRGKPDYKEAGYENVSCQWKTGREMKLGLMEFDKNVIRQFIIYSLNWIKEGMKKEEQPCFTRPNDNGNYDIGNIVVDTRYNNEMMKSRESTSRPCTLIASVNGSLIPEEISEYPSAVKASMSAVERYQLTCSPKTLQDRATKGKGFIVNDKKGNVLHVLLQTDYSKNPNSKGILKVKIGEKIYYPF